MLRALDLTGSTMREPMGPSVDGLSSASFERVVIDGDSYVIKRLSYETDWVMRAVADVGVPRVVRMWSSGLFTRLPSSIDTALVDVAFDPETGLAELLMRDVAAAFLPDNAPISLDQQALLVETMAEMHAATADLTDDLALTEPAQRWRMLGPGFAVEEAERGPLSGVPALLGPMWERLGAHAPQLHGVLTALATDPTPLVNALSTTPTSLVHGDWKGGNLGILDDRTVVLVDWAFPGIDAPCADLGWYVAVNCDRLPESKEATIERYRTALEAYGVDTAPWWDRQLPLALTGAAVQMAWSKCDQPDELAWWSGWVTRGSALM